MAVLSMDGPGGRFLDFDEAPARTLAQLSLRARRRWTGLALVGLSALALIAGGARLLARPGIIAPPVAASPAPAPKNPWVEVSRPLRFYGLESPEFGREPRLYEAMRHVDGGGRKDILSFGPETLGGSPSLRLSIYRLGTENEPENRFFVDIARLAARNGLAVTRSAQPGDLPSRFGAFEAADIVMSTPNGEVACLGFRLNHAKPDMRISGYACGSREKPIDRRTLACAIDRLDLVSAGEDQELSRFFAAAEQARGAGCGGARGGGARRTTWLEPGQGKPALRQGDVSGKSFAREPHGALR